MKYLRLMTLMLFISSCSCTDENSGTAGEGTGSQPEDTKDVTAYVTTADATKLFVKSTFNFSDTNVLKSSKILYDKTALLQEVDGFGVICLIIDNWLVILSGKVKCTFINSKLIKLVLVVLSSLTSKLVTC